MFQIENKLLAPTLFCRKDFRAPFNRSFLCLEPRVPRRETSDWSLHKQYFLVQQSGLRPLTEKNKAGYMPIVAKANHEIIRQYTRTALIYCDWLMN